MAGSLNVNGRMRTVDVDPQTPLLRIQEMLVVEVHIVESTIAPTGVGEPGVPPLAPAVTNAIAKFGAPQIRRLPLLRAGLVSA